MEDTVVLAEGEYFEIYWQSMSICHKQAMRKTCIHVAASKKGDHKF